MIKNLFKMQQDGLQKYFMAYVDGELRMLSTSSINKLNSKYNYGINVSNSRYPRFYKSDEIDKLTSDFKNLSTKCSYLDINTNKWYRL